MTGSGDTGGRWPRLYFHGVFVSPGNRTVLRTAALHRIHQTEILPRSLLLFLGHKSCHPAFPDIRMAIVPSYDPPHPNRSDLPFKGLGKLGSWISHQVRQQQCNVYLRQYMSPNRGKTPRVIPTQGADVVWGHSGEEPLHITPAGTGILRTVRSIGGCEWCTVLYCTRALGRRLLWVPVWRISFQAVITIWINEPYCLLKNKTWSDYTEHTM